MSNDPLASALQFASSSGMMAGMGLRSGVGTALASATGTLLGIDGLTEAIPVIGAITDGLTIAAGAGALIADVFDKPPAPKAIIKAALPVVAQQLGA